MEVKVLGDHFLASKSLVKKMKTKKIQIIETKTNKALKLSQEIVINNQETLSQGVDFLKKIKITGQMIKEQKEKITKPLNQALKEARDMFRPIESNYLQAERIVKQKILNYNLEQERIKKEKEKKLAERVDRGTMKMETAVKKIEKMPEVKNEGRDSKVKMREIKEIVIENESKLPRKYLMPNNVLIRRDALNGIKIEGVKVITKKIVAVSY